MYLCRCVHSVGDMVTENEVAHFRGSKNLCGLWHRSYYYYVLVCGKIDARIQGKSLHLNFPNAIYAKGIHRNWM